jgi:Tfp pilus assembly protein PilO
MAQQSQSTSVVLLLLLTFGTLFALNSFTRPQLEKSVQTEADAKSKLAGLKEDAASLRAAKANLATAKSTLEEQGVSFNALSSHMPKTEQLPGLYKQVQATIKSNSGVKEVAYQIGQPVIDPATALARVPFTINGTGAYSDLRTFVTALSNDVRPLTITQLTYTVATKSDVANGYTASITGYFAAEGLSASFVTTTK